MNILCIGDFHGKCPNLSSVIKKNKIELILSSGDIPDTDILRKLEFKHWNLLSLGYTLSQIVGTKKYFSILKKSLESQDIVLNKLNSYGLPVVLVWGNSDISKKWFKNAKNSLYKKYLLETILKKYKNIKLIQSGRFVISNVCVLAHSGYRFPSEKTYYSKRLDLNTKLNNKKWDLSLNKLFSKQKNNVKKTDKKMNTIFLAHEPPYNNKLDLVRYKKSPLYGKHIGDEYFLKYVKKYSPSFMVCGHMHENQGKITIGVKKSKTIVVDCGSAHDSQYAIINTNSKKILFYKNKKIN